MTRQKIEWLLPSTPESLLMLDDPVEGLRPKWLPPGTTGDVLQIDDLGRLAWGQSPATMTWPLLAPDGVVTAPSYAFASASGVGMFLAPEELTLKGVDETTFLLTTEADPNWGQAGIAVLDAAGGFFMAGSFAGGTPATTLAAGAPGGEYFMALMTNGSGITEVRAGGELDLVTKLTVSPYTPTTWKLKTDGTLTLPGPIRAPDGTAAAPSYSFASAPGLGLSLYPADASFNQGLRFTESSGGILRLMSWTDGTPEVRVEHPGGASGYLGAWVSGSEKGAYVGSDVGSFDIYSDSGVWTITTGTGAFIPATDNAFDLGDPTHQIRDFYLSGQILVDGVPLSTGGVTYPLLAPNGSGAAPSYTFTAAPGTGMWRDATGLKLISDGRVTINAHNSWEWNFMPSLGGLQVSTDNAEDIGSAGSGRPRSIYAGTSFLAPDGMFAAPSYSFAVDTDTGFALAAGAGNGVVWLHNGSPRMHFGVALNIGSEGALRFTQSAWATDLADVVLARDAPGILAQRNGANAQTFRVYEAYTDASNWSALELGGASTMTVLSRPTGTGLARALRIGTVGVAPVTFTVGNANVWYIEVDNSFNPLVANADIGNDGMRVRNLFIGSGTNLKALAAAPATPPATSVVVYAKTDKKVYAKDDAGLETLLTANNPMTTVGDLIVGSTAGAPARLAAVAAGAVLASAGAGVTPTWNGSPSLANLTLTARFVQGQVTVTYSASMTIDASLGNEYIITATNGTAFTIVAPTNPVTGQRITVRIRNTTGSTLGAATWNAVFKMSAWTQPATATSRAITFAYNGTNWVEVSRTTVDVPN